MKNYFKKISLLLVLLLSPINTLAYTKTETVYANLDNKGNVTKYSIRTQLTKLDKGDIIDYSNLSDIENVNGEEKFSIDSKKITWKSTGKDIFYKGVLDEKLPISVSVKYYLNDKEVNVKDMDNKSGNVKIEYSFKNNQYNYNEGMYTPFVVTTIAFIPSKDNSNVEVDNGRVIQTGNRNIVTGISAPGLYEDIEIEELKNLDKVTITYETDKFKSNEVYFAITPKLLEEVDISELDRVDSLYSSLNTLQSGMDQLVSGSKDLSNGASSLSDGSKELNDAINKALSGSQQITNGLNQLGSGASKLGAMNELVDKLYASYIENSNLLNNIQNGTSEAQLNQGIAEATKAKTDLENTLAQVNAGISTLEQGEALGVLTEEQIVQLATLRAQKTQIEAGIQQYAQGISEAQNTLASLPTAAAKLSGVCETLSQVLSGLLGGEINDDTIKAFHNNMNSLVGGVSQIQAASSQLTSGLSEIVGGSSKLSDASSKLSDGSKTLSDGINKINNEGIKQLSGYGDKLKAYSYKVKQLVKLSEEYNGFASNNADKTLFIYKISK